MNPTPTTTAGAEPATGTGGTVIDISSLSLTFMTNDGPVEALSGIGLKVARGEFVSLIGPSGCGKTTLLRLIADLEQPTIGSITVNGISPREAMGEVAKLTAGGNGILDEAAYERTAKAVLDQRIITERPSGAWTHEITDAAGLQ